MEARDELRTFGAEARAKRLAAGLTQAEIADLARTQQAYVSQVELGKADQVPEDVLERILIAYKVLAWKSL